MKGTIFRFIPHRFIRDETALPEFSATCVHGDEFWECGAESPEYNTDQRLQRWMVDHRQKTGHNRYRRDYADYVLVEPEHGR
ncbi:hypothetical protein [Streptomyces sp. HNM0574]|uniref:DUF7848 domain-containing protein n=1 Tax=Streptomyces sp. HNM0574 TaxID=2714954 RepID=UPI00146CB48F|nr:hypothetical protein [Streptomyces sp. HNM0574]NLU67744.1 hypothetical protein [Streptomyces sp. HNM0574]